MLLVSPSLEIWRPPACPMCGGRSLGQSGAPVPTLPPDRRAAGWEAGLPASGPEGGASVQRRERAPGAAGLRLRACASDLPGNGTGMPACACKAEDGAISAGSDPVSKGPSAQCRRRHMAPVTRTLDRVGQPQGPCVPYLQSDNVNELTVNQARVSLQT